MSSFKTGDRVRIVDRELLASDIKSGLYYDYFRNLTGVVERVYEDDTASVKIDLESLPVDVERRHHEVEDAAKRRWLSNVSDEQKDKLSEKEKTVTLSYNVLVASKDLEPSKGKPKPRKIEEEPVLKAPEAPKAAKTTEPTETRPSESDIEKAEEEYLKAIAEKANS